MTSRTFRPGRWLEKAKRAGIIVQLSRAKSQVEFVLPMDRRTKAATVRIMGEIFIDDLDEATRRYTNVAEMVFRRDTVVRRAMAWPAEPSSA